MIRMLLKLAVVGLFLPSIAFAHTGVGETAGLIHGLSHPLSGIDHLLAMIAIGIWAAQMGGRALWVVPTTFVAVMVLGSLLGLANIALPWVEVGIVLSVLVLGGLIAGDLRFSVVLSSLLVGVFAVFHGFAHGAEIPAAASAVSYGIGFGLSTVLLHLLGIGFGQWIHKINLPALGRFAGGMIALSGVYLVIA